ncbi:MAG: tyrosine-protein phosphatase [Chloroflexota bacterium]
MTHRAAAGAARVVPGREPGIATLPNLRDVGGHLTRDGGHVRTGLLYRSADLSRIDQADAAALARLGIRTIYDLRTTGERAGHPDRLPPGSAYFVADILGDSAGMTPAEFATLFEDPAAAERALAGGRSAIFFVSAYREFVRLDSARAGYRRLFSDLADGASTPALFHCTTGKDRTGWAAAALLTLLGVPDDEVMEDYLLSGPRLLPVVRPMVDAFAARGGDPELLWPLVGVRPDYLEAALDEVHRLFGSIEGYFAEGLGLDAPAQGALRGMLVERG